MPIQTTSNTEVTSIALHPHYATFLDYFTEMRDTFAGEAVIKSKGETYLPMTSGQMKDNQNGAAAYEAYKTRAVFYDYVSDTVTDMLGLLHKETTQFKLPTALEPLLLKSTPDGETISMLLRRIHEEQLIPGRIGLLLDVPSDAAGVHVVPQVVTYNAETIVNWDIGSSVPRWYVLDESGYQMKGNLDWEMKVKYRLIALDGMGKYYTRTFDKWPGDIDIDNPDEEAVYPTVRGKMSNEIPFQIINAASVLPGFEFPPLLSIANLSLATYRGESDYRQALFMQAQSTLFLKGFGDDELNGMRVGAGAAIKTTNTEATAEFIEVSGAGLFEMRLSQENLMKETANLGVEMVDKNGVESGDAIITRLTVRTASMSSVAKSAAAGLTKILQIAARWVGANDSEVIIIPATDFSDSLATSKNVLEMWSVVQQGGMALEDYHSWLSERDYTSDTFEDWKSKLEAALPSTTLTNVQI